MEFVLRVRLIICKIYVYHLNAIIRSLVLWVWICQTNNLKKFLDTFISFLLSAYMYMPRNDLVKCYIIILSAFREEIVDLSFRASIIISFLLDWILWRAKSVAFFSCLFNWWQFSCPSDLLYYMWNGCSGGLMDSSSE